MDQFSVGAFVNLHRHEPDLWRAELEHLDRQGVDHVELWLEYEPEGRQTRDLVSVFGGRRTIMHGPFIGMSLASEWRALAGSSLDRCHRAIEVAGAIGCELVTLHAGAHAVHSGHEAALERLARRFARFVSLSSPVVTLENMSVRGGATQEALACGEDLSALTALLPGLQVTLDVGHILQNGEDPAAAFSEHGHRIRNVHLHDGRRAGRAHLPLGQGELDLDAFLEPVCAGGYSGFVTIETLDRDGLAQSLSALEARSWRDTRACAAARA